MKTRLILVRHAEAEGNITRHFHGWTEGELTEKGHLQAQLVAKRLVDLPMDILYASSMKRTLQTASYIKTAKGLSIIPTDQMKEINGGDWEGMLWEELPIRWPDAFETWEHQPHLHQMPCGETMADFQNRLITEIQRLLTLHAGKSIGVITHGTAIKALMCHFKGVPLEHMPKVRWYDNTAVTVVDYENGSYHIVLEGDATHLDHEMSTLHHQEWYLEHQEKILKLGRDGFMKDLKTKLVSWLFETNALRVCPEDKPFWYTSGKIGPYYINTHFLYGSEEKANQLLAHIDAVKSEKNQCPQTVLHKTLENYENDAIYHALINGMIAYIKENIGVENIDYISGGERRDWFFSLILAELLKKPHITIYKDLSFMVLGPTGVMEDAALAGKNVLHIADLITVASSYDRAWIPALQNAGAHMKWSVVVVDRKQGGGELLVGLGVQSHAMIDIDDALFEQALALGLIQKKQYDMIIQYNENPDEAMKQFLLSHPLFLKNEIAGGGKNAERAELCMSKNIYGIAQSIYGISV